MANIDVPDSTDWLSTPLSGLAAVESALRCEVCKDFYKTPMITSCCHTFCSLCIRRALSNDGKCPLCRASDQQPRLRSNWAMEETVEAFVKARTATLDLARRRDEASSAPKRKAENESVETSDAPEGKRLRTSARLRKTRIEAPADPIEIEEEEVVEVPDEDEYVPEDGLVPCPVCQNRMKEWQVFAHLESCTGPTPSKPKPKPKASSSSSTAAFSQRQAHQTKSLERLPGLNYSMLKEAALRRKLVDLGISNQGPRMLLERRHKEWITIWNANCDSVRPRKRNELLHDLDAWERTQGGRALTMGRMTQMEPMVKDKEFDGAAWGAKHNSSFQDLIANARQSRLEAKKKAEEAKKEAAEEEASRTAEVPPSSSLSEMNCAELLTASSATYTSEQVTSREPPTSLNETGDPPAPPKQIQVIHGDPVVHHIHATYQPPTTMGAAERTHKDRVESFTPPSSTMPAILPGHWHNNGEDWRGPPAPDPMPVGRSPYHGGDLYSSSRQAPPFPDLLPTSFYETNWNNEPIQGLSTRRRPDGVPPNSSGAIHKPPQGGQ
ncbi:hypothetical protein B0T10DRAFT_487391 [Thelonectria olida]|uniref:Postreplication repair E3 ubiquitin-protein ligase RAD18 n=1 Tax=Thelonectria olida TaxID=1576542 RepID=A0A9P8W330_9HYPO|nr:hypothetical protein B0T10DRAFT_487391 [Thelonectria olida]